MRFLVLVALCLAVASASYTNRNRFNRLLRNMRQQQQYQGQDQEYGQGYQGQDQDQDQENGCGPQCQLRQLYGDSDEQDEFQNQQQCRRNQGCRGGLDFNDDETEYDSDEQDNEQNNNQYGYQNQYQGQGRQQRQQRQNQYQNEYENEYQGQGRQQGQQQRRQQQQRHQCQPQYQLLQDLEQPNCQLASKLYKQAKQENDDKNTVVSPAALQLALAAIQRGARGQTKRQIQRIIGAGLSKQQNRQAHTALQQSLQGQDPTQRQSGQPRAQIKCSTTIVINQRNQAQQQFIQAVKACLNTQVKKCNFQQQPQQCRQQINRLVAQKTHQKLQHVVPQDAVTENTKMIVVNTAQVKAQWGRQFRQQQQTKQGRFYPLGCQQPKHVQVMKAQGQFNYYEDAQMKVVGIPTQQEEMTLYVMVPKNKDGLNQVEKSQIQDGQQLKQLLEQAEQQKQQVEIELPKFQIKHKLDAKQTLRQQGVQDIFDADQCDLSGVNGQQPQEQQQRRRRQQQNGQEEEEQYQYQQDGQQGQQQLHVNKLIHQATIKVDEQGIHAARPQQGNQQYEQNQEQDQEYEQDEEGDEQEQQYMRQQYQHQETFDQIFGQGQRRRQQQQRRRQQQQQRLRRQNQWQQNQGQGQDQDQDQDQDEYENGQYGQQGQYGQGQVQVKANRAFAFALKHNPSNQIVLVGRVVDATQKPKNHQQGQRQRGQQSLNGVDQQ